MRTVMLFVNETVVLPSIGRKTTRPEPREISASEGRAIEQEWIQKIDKK